MSDAMSDVRYINWGIKSHRITDYHYFDGNSWERHTPERVAELEAIEREVKRKRKEKGTK